jgi:methionyl-tRNA formyltransferase
VKYVYLANGSLGRDVLRWLVERGTPPAGVVVHPPQRSRERDAIEALARSTGAEVIEAPALRTPRGASWIRSLAPDWLLSVLFGYILRDDVLGAARYGALNLHPALLPYNRGAYPNVWAIVDKTPAGVTLHYMAPGRPVDTGEIVARRAVPILATDTGLSLYRRLEEAALALFRETWPLVEAGDPPRTEQEGVGTYHTVADAADIDRIDPNALVRAGDLIDVLRARTFPPYTGAYLDLGDRRVHIRVELTEESAAVVQPRKRQRSSEAG